VSKSSQNAPGHTSLEILGNYDINLKYGYDIVNDQRPSRLRNVSVISVNGRTVQQKAGEVLYGTAYK